MMQLASHADVWMNLLLMIVLVTIVSFGLQTHFQPRLDPTRAALLYLVEPIFAAGYAWVMAGKSLAPLAVAGAGLIVVANLMVEIIQSRRRSTADIDPGAGAAIID
ncbi:MAG: EamA family transporter, partial [Tepidisphaeraceae bacterium]